MNIGRTFTGQPKIQLSMNDEVAPNIRDCVISHVITGIFFPNSPRDQKTLVIAGIHCRVLFLNQTKKKVNMKWI